jgi:hypothetical protein
VHISSIAAGGHHSLALASADGISNSIGTGTGTSASIDTGTGSGIVTGTGIVNGTGAAGTACGNKEDNVEGKGELLFVFGNNSYGQLGTGDTTDRLLPHCLRVADIATASSSKESASTAAVNANATPTSIHSSTPISTSTSTTSTAITRTNNEYEYLEEKQSLLSARPVIATVATKAIKVGADKVTIAEDSSLSISSSNTYNDCNYGYRVVSMSAGMHHTLLTIEKRERKSGIAP